LSRIATHVAAAPLAGPTGTDRAQQVLQQARGRGMRGTSACRYVLEQLSAFDGHLSADELFTTLPPALAGCDRSTIHRQLTRLQHAGVLHAVPTAHGLAYGLRHNTEHDHESCQHCGKTLDRTAHQGQVGHPSPAFLTTIATNVTLGSCSTCAQQDH